MAAAQSLGTPPHQYAFRTLCCACCAGPQVEEGALQDVDPAVQDVVDLEFGL